MQQLSIQAAPWRQVYEVKLRTDVECVLYTGDACSTDRAAMHHRQAHLAVLTGALLVQALDLVARWLVGEVRCRRGPARLRNIGSSESRTKLQWTCGTSFPWQRSSWVAVLPASLLLFQMLDVVGEVTCRKRLPRVRAMQAAS